MLRSLGYSPTQDQLKKLMDKVFRVTLFAGKEVPEWGRVKRIPRVSAQHFFCVILQKRGTAVHV